MSHDDSRLLPIRGVLGRWLLLVGALSAALALAGCGSPEADSAHDAAVRFANAAAQDPRQACALLAPRTRDKVSEDGDGDCAAGLKAAGLPSAADTPGPKRVEVAGHTARVALAGQAIFLSLFNDGWKVTAAGCSRESTNDNVPYRCDVEGG